MKKIFIILASSLLLASCASIPKNPPIEEKPGIWKVCYKDIRGFIIRNHDQIRHVQAVRQEARNNFFYVTME